MATPIFYPEKYLLYNQQQSKKLAIVMVIEDVPYIFGISDTFEIIRYGTAGLFWGSPGLVWGGLKKVGGLNGVGGVKTFIQLDPSMVIQQRIEPEQGRGNVATISMTLIDYNGEVSYMIAPGNVVDEIMCGKQTTIYIGFQQTSFPQDYVVLYRGYITSLDTPPGIVRFQISDGTMKSRQPIASTPSTLTTSIIDDSQTNIPVISTAGFYQQIQGPDGSYLDRVHTYIQIDDEVMEYAFDGIVDSENFTVIRGSLGTLAAAHDINSPVTNSIQLGENAPDGGINFIDCALGLLLSGWNGPCEENIPLISCGADPTPVGLFYFILGIQNNSQVDAFLTLGLSVGDYCYVTGATNVANNITGIITDIQYDANGFASIVKLDTPFNSYEHPTDAVTAFRSQYDVFPIGIGAGARMRDVDVFTWAMVRDNYFLSSIYEIAMYYNEPVFAKETIAADLCLPMGCYQISRFGRVSISVTKPPLPGGTQTLVQLDYTNVLNPDQIHVMRSTNNRTFYNQVSYEYDLNPVTGTFSSIEYFLDVNSASLFNQVLTLPIQAKAFHTLLGNGNVASQRGSALLTRYSKVAIILDLSVNWSVGSRIEVSDIVLIVDNGNLQIMNFATGERNLGSQLFEVIDRSYDVTNGNVKLKVLSGLDFNINSRFGLISPSTVLAMGSTSTSLRVTPSYGQTSIADELLKWSPYFGQPIVVHNTDFTTSGTGILQGLDPSDPTALLLSSPLGFTPDPGYILEIADYPTSTNQTENSQYKALYAYITPTIPVVSGSSTTVFQVSSPNAALMTVDNYVILRTDDWNTYTNEVQVTDITGTTITVSPALKNAANGTPITPDNTYVVEGIGFKDGLGFYRYD